MEDRKYYKVNKLSHFFFVYDIDLGDICIRDKDSFFYFPKLKTNILVFNNELEEITKEEYMRELWKIKNTTK